jgi:hypothetical protein
MKGVAGLFRKVADFTGVFFLRFGTLIVAPNYSRIIQKTGSIVFKKTGKR